ncbi:MAG: hypothetical protein J6J65_00425 [Opitutales bacterium]|nr:hypothetical protein [Opitutales bacterium]
MYERDKNLLNIGVLLSEDMERIEVMYEGFDMGCFILGMLDAEMRGLNSPEALEHLRALYGMFSSPARTKSRRRRANNRQINLTQAKGIK